MENYFTIINLLPHPKDRDNYEELILTILFENKTL